LLVAPRMRRRNRRRAPPASPCSTNDSISEARHRNPSRMKKSRTRMGDERKEPASRRARSKAPGRKTPDEARDGEQRAVQPRSPCKPSLVRIRASTRTESPNRSHRGCIARSLGLSARPRGRDRVPSRRR
jgi:hypothetical protein